MGKKWFSLYVPRIPWHEEENDELTPEGQAAYDRTVETWRNEHRVLSHEEAIHGDHEGECRCRNCGCGHKHESELQLGALSLPVLDAGDPPLNSGRGKGG